MPPVRRLSGEEAAMWERLTQSVRPLPGRRVNLAPIPAISPPAAVLPPAAVPATMRFKPAPPRLPQPQRLDVGGLDGTWERRLARGAVPPDATIDLHGDTLDTAYARLDHTLGFAIASGARLVLVITGKPRPQVEGGDRGQRGGAIRGVIRAKLLDWLAHGAHAGRIATVRGAAPRHGGVGAVYVVLKRAR